MRLRDWFKSKKAKAIAMLGCFAMLLGVGASVSVVSAVKENEVVETKAAAPSAGTYIYAYNAPGWSNLYAHAWPDGGSGTTWPGVKMTKIGTSNTYYASISSIASYNRLILHNNSGDQTENLTVNYGSTRVFHDFGKNSSYVNAQALNEVKLVYNKTNNFSSYSTATFSWSEHKYSVTVTLDDVTYFDIVVGSTWMNYEVVQSHLTGVGITQADGDYGKHRFKTPKAGTLTISLTPAVNVYGEKYYIFDGNEGTASFKTTVTYEYRSTDSETLSASPASVSVQMGTSTTLPQPTISGYKFYKWYTAYSAGLFSGSEYAGGSSYTVNANITLYARYIASGFGYYLSSNNSWNPTTSCRFTNDSPSGGWRKINRTIAKDEEFYLFYCNATTTDGNYHYVDLDGGDARGNFGNSSGNFKCNLAGTYDIILNTTTGKVYIYYSAYTTDTGYRMVGTGSFTTGTAWAFSAGLPMVSSGSGLGTNTAVLADGTTGIAVTSGSLFRVYKHDGIASLTAYSMTLGGTYTGFAADRGDNIEITKTGSYNFYFKIDNGTNYIYIVDVSEIANAGTLYFSSSESDINEISVTTTNTEEDPQNPFDGDPLGDVSGAQKLTTTVKFNGNYIYSVPIFNLRGDDSGSPISDVTFSWSGGSIVISALTAIGGSGQQYYLIGSGPAASMASTTECTALQLALDIETAINGATDKSACNVKKATAAGLVTRYGSASKTYLDDATINTYNPASVTLSNLNTSTSPKTDVAISVIMSKTLGPISRGEDPSPSLVLPNGQQESSPLTLTLWIVLGAGVLGLGAIGTAYFVSKKKKKHQA